MATTDREKAIGRLFIATFIAFQLALFAPMIALPETTWAIVLLVFAVASSATALVLARPLSLRFRIVSLSVCYIGLTIGFASLHYLLFVREPQAYVFADAIRATQLSATVAAAARDLETTQVELALLAEIDNDADSALGALQKGDRFVLGSGASVQLLVETYMTPPTGSFTTHRLVMQTSTEKYIVEGDIIGDPRAAAVRALARAKTTPELRLGVEQLRTALVGQQRDAVAILSRGLPVWGYADFLYFSAVTISTVGFGDIVPASRASRLLVGCEAMGGVLLVAFALAFIWPDQGSDRPIGQSTA